MNTNQTKTFGDHLRPTLPAIFVVGVIFALLALFDATFKPAPKPELVTSWAGLITIGRYVDAKQDVGVLTTAELGLREDGVVVWRIKDEKDNQAKK